MNQPVQVDVFFPEQPFGGVLTEMPSGLKQIAFFTGQQGPPGGPGPIGPPGDPDQGIENGIMPLINGQSIITVIFNTPQTDTNWSFRALAIVNTIDPDALNLVVGTIIEKSTSGFTALLSGAPDSDNYLLMWGIVGLPVVVPDATFYLITGPSSGEVGSPSTPFTVRIPTGTTLPAPVTITLSDGGAGGTFTPATVGLSALTPSTTFTYTPASSGLKTITATNDGGLTDPAGVGYTGTISPHLLDTLISYFKLDEGAGASRADSKGTNTLTDTSAAGSFAAIINNGAYFNAGQNWLFHADNSDFRVSGDFTFAGWIRIDDTNTRFSISKYDGSNTQYALYHDAATGLTFGNGSNIAAVGAPATPFGWLHFVGWYDTADNKFRLRINDTTTYVSPTAAALVAPNSGDFRLGALVGAFHALNHNGLLDEVGLWKRKLNTAEITALYGGGSGLPFSSFTA